MKLDNKNILVTGANRGIGKAIVEALLKQDVGTVYAAARNLGSLPDFNDARVVPIALDITSRNDIDTVTRQIKDLDLLINNAGALAYASVVTGNTDDLVKDMQVNYFGTLSIVNAFAPQLEKRGGGAIANVISVLGLASMAGVGGYSASKAALFSATQAMRGELKPKNITVHGIFPGPIDTDMAKGIEMEKASPKTTAENIVQGLIDGQEDIFPDPMSAEVGKLWAQDPKQLERQFAAF